MIIEDEPLAIKLLETYIAKLDYLNLVSSHSNPLEGLAALKQTPIDLLFLDIQMPELSGLQLARVIPDRTKIIFTTAYPDHAVEGFELKALDYLLKPISLYRFIDAVGRYKQENPKVPMQEGDRNFIFVKTEHRKQKIDLSDLVFLKGMGDYCQLVLRQSKVMTLEKMQSFETRLPGDRFIRVHKSYIISVEKIEYIENGKIRIGEQLIPIGSTYEKKVKEVLK